jgi:hypothetical protein
MAGLERRDVVDHAWRLLLECQPHDSICGCSVDEVHRDIAARLRQVEQLAGCLVDEAVQSLADARAPDFPLHRAIAIVNPHPFPTSGVTEVEVQRHLEDLPFRLMGEGGEIPYEILARTPSDGPDLRPSAWLRVRLSAEDLPPLGLRLAALEPGEPMPFVPPAARLAVRPLKGGLEIVDPESGLEVLHTFEDQGDRGDLYDFCPCDEQPPRSSRDHHMGVRLIARAIGRRVEIEAQIDNRSGDHRLRARFDLSSPPSSIWTETAFGWLERAAPGTHPVLGVTAAPGFAVGGLGLHEVERGPDGAILLTLFRAVGWMSRGDLSTRPGHAGYHLATPDAQGLGPLTFRYSIAIGPDPVRALEPALASIHAVALAKGQVGDRPFLSVEPATVRLSLLKRAQEGAAWIVRLLGPAGQPATARLRFFRPHGRVWWSDLDERTGPELSTAGGELTVPIATDEVVTLRVDRAP